MIGSLLTFDDIVSTGEGAREAPRLGRDRLSAKQFQTSRMGDVHLYLVANKNGKLGYRRVSLYAPIDSGMLR
ncbi:hypothetical protein LCM4579_26515 [Ensifer sp. LCM 4579]|nr:hypothetical protein LCM4579_26515 [Ensifer sp. LCM 4579]